MKIIRNIACMAIVALCLGSSQVVSAQVSLSVSLSTSDTAVKTSTDFYYTIDFEISSSNQPGINVAITDTLPPHVEYRGITSSSLIQHSSFNPINRALNIYLTNPLPAGTSGSIQVKALFLPFETPNNFVATNKVRISANNATQAVFSNSVDIKAKAEPLYTIYKEFSSYDALNKIVAWKTYVYVPVGQFCTMPGVLNIQDFSITDTLPPGAKFVSADNGGKETSPGSGIVRWEYPSQPFPFCDGGMYPLYNTVAVQYPNVPYGDDVFNSTTFEGTLIGNIPFKTTSSPAQYQLSPPAGGAQCVNNSQKQFKALLQRVGDSTSLVTIPFENNGNTVLDSLVVEFAIPDQMTVTKPFAATTNGNSRLFYTTNVHPTARKEVFQATRNDGFFDYQVWDLPSFSSSEYPTKFWVRYDSVPPQFTADFNIDSMLILPVDRKGVPVVPTKQFYPQSPCDGIGTCIPFDVTIHYNSGASAGSNNCNFSAMPRSNTPLIIYANKAVPGTKNYVPGDTVFFYIYFRNNGDELKNTLITDTLDPHFEFVPGSVRSTFMKVSSSNKALCTPTFTQNGQALAFDFSTDTNKFEYAGIDIVYKARIKESTPAGTYKNTFYGQADDYPIGFQPDGTVKWMGSENIVVNKQSSMTADKGVKGILDTNYLFFPANATTVNGSEVSYKLRIKNTGNMPLKDIVLVDPLPYKGDDKGSTFTPFMATLPIANRSNVQMFYALDSNICITEVSPAVTPIGCVTPTWLSQAPSDLKKIKAVKFSLTNTLIGGDSLIVTWQMAAPTGLQMTDIAYNRFHYQARKEDNTLMLSTSPNKVGINISNKAQVGEYAWHDLNKNGLRDEAPDMGIDGLKVQLWSFGADKQPYTSDDKLMDSTMTTWRGGDPGYYSFTASPGNYYVRFVTAACRYSSNTKGVRPDFRTDTFFLSSSQIRKDINIGFVQDSVSVLEQPAACLGSTLELVGNTTSTSLSYQWQKSTDQSLSWLDIPGQTQPSLVIDPLTKSDTGVYRLIIAKQGKISDPKCQTFSNPVRVQALDSLPTPLVSDTVFCEGKNATLQPKSLPVTGSFFWYESSVGGSPLEDPLVVTTTFGTHVFYVIDSSGTAPCVSKRVPVHVQIQSCDSSISPKNDVYQIWNDETLIIIDGNHPMVNDNSMYGNLSKPSFQLLDSPLNGTIKPTSQGFEYVPNANFEGQETLRYRICDSIHPTICGTAYIFIQVKSRGIFFPTAFTPDQDGVNDSYIVYHVPQGIVVNLSFYNRWGDLVYKNEDYRNDWEGKCQTPLCVGESLPSGTYFVVANLSNGMKHTSQVTLIR